MSKLKTNSFGLIEIASICSVLGVILTILFIVVKDKDAVFIALVFLCLALFSLVILAFTFLRKFMNKSPNEYEARSTFVKYEFTDENNIIYEVHKSIQSKRPVIYEYKHPFKWTGSQPPKFESDLQKLDTTIYYKDDCRYDDVVLKLKTPLYFEQNALIHIKAIIDDSDHKSETYLSHKIEQPVDIIHHRVILKYKSHSENAILEYRKINSIKNEFKKIKEIAFDKETKSYEHHLLNPEVGYIYRIRWKR